MTKKQVRNLALKDEKSILEILLRRVPIITNRERLEIAREIRIIVDSEVSQAVRIANQRGSGPWD
jgi:hypothetical protein